MKELSEILGELGLDKLPNQETKETKKEHIWVKALALVTKKNGSKSYVLLKRDERLKEFIIKDYGCVSAIFNINKIYPFEFLQPQFIQGFSTDNLQQRIDYLKMLNLPYMETLTFDNMNLDELNKEIVCAGIFLQAHCNQYEKKMEEIKNFRIKHIVAQEKQEIKVDEESENEKNNEEVPIVDENTEQVKVKNTRINKK